MNDEKPCPPEQAQGPLMIHPDFTKGMAEQAKAAREFYVGKKAFFTGPDGRQRSAVVRSAIIDEGLNYDWRVMVHFDMARLDGSEECLEVDWARNYFYVKNRAIQWLEE